MRYDTMLCIVGDKEELLSGTVGSAGRGFVHSLGDLGLGSGSGGGGSRIVTRSRL